MVIDFFLQALGFFLLPFVYLGVLQIIRWLKAEKPVAEGRFPFESLVAMGISGVVLIMLFRVSPNPDLNSPMFLPQSTTSITNVSDIAYRTALPFPSDTPSLTPTFTATNTFTPTPTPTFTNTPTPTPTLTPTPSPTVTLTPTITNTPDPRPTLPAMCFSEPVRITTPRQNSEFDHNTNVDIFGAAYGDKDFTEIVVEYIQSHSETNPEFDKVHNHGWQKIQVLEVLEDGEKKNAKRWGGNGNEQYMTTWDWFSTYNNNDDFKGKVSEGFRVKVWLRVRAVLDDANAKTPKNPPCYIWIYLKY